MDSETNRSGADLVLQYTVSGRPLHARLQQILVQSAGFALLVMTHGRRVPNLDVPLALAGEALQSIHEQLRALPVPSQARHHYHHTMEAAVAVEQALALLVDCMRPQNGDAIQATLTRCLRVATDHLRAAARLLPGFEMVDLRQACCAHHAEAPRLARA